MLISKKVMKHGKIGIEFSRVKDKMANYITNTKGLIGSPVIQRQSILTQQATKLGILPLSIYYYPVNSDSDGELSSRLDGILSGLSFDDNVILQLPTMLGDRYEQELIQKINIFRQSSATKLIIAIHDVIMDKDKLTRMIKRYYNQADALILPSVHYGNYLQSLGLIVRQLIYLSDYDKDSDLIFKDYPGNSRNLYLLSANEVVQKKAQDERLTIINYSDADLSLLEKQNEMHQQGGIGIIWPNDDKQEFIQKMLPSQELNQFCLAGIPVIVKEGSALSRLVRNHNLGIVSEDLTQAVKTVKKLRSDEYDEMLANVRAITKLIGKGIFASRALIASLHNVQLAQLEDGD